MSKILLTGYLGFIGSHVLDALLEMNHDVLGMDNGSTGRKENVSHIPSREYMVVHSGRDIVGPQNVLGAANAFQPDVIIHLAAQPSLLTSEKDPAFDAETNIIGTINVIQAAKKYGARLIFASTSAVYDEAATLPYKESSPLWPNTPYGTSKMAAEHYIEMLMPYGMWSILRLGNVFGARQTSIGGNQIVPRLLSHLYKNEPFEIYGDGDNVRDYIYAKDVARTILMSITTDYSGIYNLARGIGVSTNEITKLIISLSSHKKKSISKSSEVNDTRNVILNISSLKRTDMYISPTSLEIALQETIKHYEEMER